jgi:hypothetical protein
MMGDGTIAGLIGPLSMAAKPTSLKANRYVPSIGSVTFVPRGTCFCW